MMLHIAYTTEMLRVEHRKPQFELTKYIQHLTLTSEPWGVWSELFAIMVWPYCKMMFHGGVW